MLERLGPWAGVAAAAVLILVLGSTAAEFQLQQWTAWVSLSILAMSFMWVWGYGGIFSFAQVAFFGVGAYAYGFAGINLSIDTGETLTAVLIGTVAASLLAVVIGYFLFYGEVSGVYVGIATLAVSLVFYTLTSSLSDPKYAIGDAQLGGFNGMVGIPPIMVPGTPFLTVRGLFLVVAGTALVVATAIVVLRRSTFGRVVRAVEHNEGRAKLLGYDVRRTKLIVFAIGGAIAGLAGALYAGWGTFVDPSVFGLRMATMLVIWVLVGGRTSIIGAIVGVFFVEQLSTSIAETGSVITPMILGAILIGVVLLIPEGLVPTAAKLARRILPRRPAPDAEEDLGSFGNLPDISSETGGKSLAVNALVRKFGGVTAVNGVDLDLGDRGVRVLLGPNGAGKSTLFHLLIGTYRPSSGAVLLDGIDVSKSRPDRRARSGMAIKLQVTSPFTALSVAENLWLAAYGASRDRATADRLAHELSQWLGYPDGTRVSAGSIAHGKQQWLDIAMALAMRPAVLLLDEPAAGLGRAESTRIADLVREIGEQVLVVVVEHDMQFVKELQAPVWVLHQGQLLTHGTLDEVRANERVLEVYLGRDTHADN